MKYPYIQSVLHHPFTETDLPIPEKSTGNVRDIYKPEDGKLLLVTTDRLSAFDRILGSTPFKGQVLNQLSAWWFEQIQEIRIELDEFISICLGAMQGIDKDLGL